MTSACKPLTRLIALAGAFLVVLAIADPASAQAADREGRLVREVHFSGLEQTPEQLVRNAIRTEAGQPYRSETIAQDIVRLTFLGRFDTIDVQVKQNADTSLVVTFELAEQPTLLSIEFVGSSRFDDEELEGLVLLRVGDQIDKSLIDKGARTIQLEYALKGNFAASVSYDKKRLAEKRELVYKITEGPRVRISELRFEGNAVFDDDRLYSQVSSEEQFWPFVAGFMDRTDLDQDAATLRKYYQDRGYLDAQVGRKIELSPRQTRAIVTFEINEGQQKTVREIKVVFRSSLDGPTTNDHLMSAEQIRYVLPLVSGGVYTDNRLENSREAIRYWYGHIGFINTKVRINSVFDPDKPVVDVVVEIEEGTGPTIVGDVPIIGLTRTQQKVLLRRIRGLEPGRPVNLQGLDETRELVKQSIWFSNGTITPLGDPDDPIRDFLIQANEKNTGMFRIGAGLSSDSGIFGTIAVEQRNFDIADIPESFDEFLAQRAFLGAGQTFNITLAPGNDTSTYAIGFREPYLFETDYFFETNLSAVQSVREDFDEGRISLRTGIGRRLGDVWTGNVRIRLEQIDIDAIEPSAPLDVAAVAGESQIGSIAVGLVRSTTDSNLEPSRGARLRLGLEQFGALGGDYNFTRLAMGYDQFWTLDQDFLGRKTILSLKFDGGYIPQDTADIPLFERFYSGGRDFRGFAFRGVGPRGIRSDTLLLGNDPVGGRFQFITRLQYDFPIYERALRWAFFTDQGTIQESFGFDQWRVAVGTGMRINLPFFSQAPIAIDFGFPLIEEATDETQLISFSFELPFN